MTHFNLTAISPLDGRYAKKTEALRDIVSEYALIKWRFIVEINWLMALASTPSVTNLEPFSEAEKNFLEQLIAQFSVDDAACVKTIEQTTNHDVKALEYFIQEKLRKHATLARAIPFIHFCATSEDINNLAYALMLKTARQAVLIPAIQQLIDTLIHFAREYAELPMLARTHGQAATPTTLGKEFANVAHRLQRQLAQFSATELLGKCNGAVGNFNAHLCAYPDADWPAISQQFIENLGLTFNPYTTQIEPHDFYAEFLQALSRINTILIDMNRDIWGYISLGYLVQKKVDSEVGSSTMPHKVNPIDFENGEGNLGMANALIEHFAAKLPISRWQRDLSDSTVVRNFGTIFGHCLLAYQSTQKGLGKITADAQRIQADLSTRWEVLAEAVQTVMRSHGISDAYEQLKAFTRGRAIDEALMTAFIEQLEIPNDAKQRLHALTPENYLGCAAELATVAKT